MPTRYYRFAFTVLFSLLSTLFGTAQQQGTRYFASGEGYVTYTYQVFNYQCGAGPFQQWLYTNLDYVDPNGGHNTIGGGGAYFVSPGGPNCPANGPQPTNGIKVGSTAQGFMLNFVAGPNGNPSANIGFTGSVNPTYEVVSVLYAPPGSQSYADYSQTTMVGTSTSMSSSFESSVSQSVSFGASGSIFGSGGSWTATAGNSLSQTQDSSGSIDISYQKTQGYKILGPSSDALGLYHPADEIDVWLNPVANLTVSSGKVDWGSYSWDSRDPLHNIDILRLTVYELQNWSWFCNTYPVTCSYAEKTSWNPSGGLTSSDLVNIAAHDPYSSGSPSPDPTRYYGPTNGSAIPYQGPGCPSCQPATWYWNSNYSVTNTQGQGAKIEYSISFDITQKFSIFHDKVSTELKDSTKFTWTNKWSSSQTTKLSQAAMVSITGPAWGSGYTGPTQFNMFQDNVYGTYMFYARPN